MRYTLSLILIFTASILFAQPSATKVDDRIGLIKTAQNKVLGYGFVAMNNNVIFTAADNITFDQEMIFEDSNGKIYSLRVVATDKVGNIGVLMSSEDISQKPFGLNLNYSIDSETELFSTSSEMNNDNAKSSLQLVGKNSKIQKSKEFKFIELTSDNSIEYTGMPIINAYGEVIGLISNKTVDDSKQVILTGSIMDGQMWKKM